MFLALLSCPKPSKDDSAQAFNLIRGEIEQASLVQTSATYPTTCSTVARTVRLAITGKNGALTTIYATQSVPASSTDWSGPFVLVRCGPVYSSAGVLAVGSDPTESIVLDRLPLAISLTATINKSSSTLARDVRVDTRTQAGSGSPIDISSDVRIISNPMFSLYDLCVNDSPSCSGGASPCNSTSDPVLHCRPLTSAASITGDSIKSDVVYFPGARSSYTIQKASGDSSACTRTSCYVSGGGFGVQMANVNVLAFSDGELRL